MSNEIKAIVTEEIDFPAYACKLMSEIGWKGFTTEQLRDFTNKAIDSQSRIKELEQEVIDLRIAGQKLQGILLNLRDHGNLHESYDDWLYEVLNTTDEILADEEDLNPTEETDSAWDNPGCA